MIQDCYNVTNVVFVTNDGVTNKLVDKERKRLICLPIIPGKNKSV